MIIWLTGQPCSGKTTLSNVVVNWLRSIGKSYIHIDGDDLRYIFENNDYSIEGRRLNIKLGQNIAKLSNKFVDYVIVSMVSPFRDQRENFKKEIGSDLKEIYLYSSRIKEGRMVNMYEPPIDNFLSVNTDQNIETCIHQMLEHIFKYDFIEIGSSDFNTLVEECKNSDKGIVIEPLSCYLDKLPNKPNITKLNVAISIEDGTTDIYSVYPRDIELHNLPNWVKGCNSLTPHPTVVSYLNERGLIHLYQKTIINTMSLKTLFKKTNVIGVDLLKIDTEGMDCIILDEWLKIGTVFPNTIIFESNQLTNRDLEAWVVVRLKRLNYVEVKSEDPDNRVFELKEPIYFPVQTDFICYTSMVGDFFHEGHQRLLQRCKKMFSKVIVGIHNDEDVMSYKERPYNSYKERLDRIRQSGLADEIYENAPAITTLELIDKLNIDYVVAGKEDVDRINRMYPIPDSRLLLIDRTPGISSGQIKNLCLFDFFHSGF